MWSWIWQASCQRTGEEKSAMLRITACDSSGATRLLVEGKLAGACVGELEKCWRENASTKWQETSSGHARARSPIYGCRTIRKVPHRRNRAFRCVAKQSGQGRFITGAELLVNYAFRSRATREAWSYLRMKGIERWIPKSSREKSRW